MPTIHFVSLISRDDRPLYIQGFDVGDANDLATANTFLKYNFLSHMALDVFSSPVSLNLREQQQSSGVLLLFLQDDITVYGLETNNGLKIVVGMSEEESRQAVLASFFSQIHKCYLKTVCNPFTDLTSDTDSILLTPKFDKSIRELVDRYEPTG